jgi:hypothetical protein
MSEAVSWCHFNTLRKVMVDNNCGMLRTQLGLLRRKYSIIMGANTVNTSIGCGDAFFIAAQPQLNITRKPHCGS